jgi:hypothetical protein
MSMNMNGRGKWDGRRKLVFHRFMSYLQFWEARKFQIRLMTLTTATGGDADKLVYHFRLLLRRIGREFGFRGVQYVGVRTGEGNGVLHLAIAWKGRKAFLVPKDWLHKAWEELHGAWATAIDAYEKVGAERAASYAAGQYAAGQAGLLRCFGSVKQTFGFSLVKLWVFFKKAHEGAERKAVVGAWSRLLRGENVSLPGRPEPWVLNLDALRGRREIVLVRSEVVA